MPTQVLSIDSANATALSASLALNAVSTEQAQRITEQAASWAVSTQAQQATSNVLALTPSAATAVSLKATQDSIVAQSTLDAHHQSTQQALDGERISATSNAIAISATQEVERQSNATNASALVNYLGVCFGVVLLVLFASLSVVLVNVTHHWSERRHVDSMLHNTPTGLYLVYVSGDSVVSRPIDAPEQRWQSVATLPDVPSDASRTLLVRDSGRPQRTIDWPAPAQALSTVQSDATKLADVLTLLSDAMNATTPAGRKVPRFDKLTHYKTRPAEWGKVTDRLVQCGLAEKRAGPPPKGGTFITGGYTLYTLSAALQSGRVKLRRIGASSTATTNVNANASRIVDSVSNNVS